jgi:hypothetical protein
MKEKGKRMTGGNAGEGKYLTVPYLDAYGMGELPHPSSSHFSPAMGGASPLIVLS